MRNFPSLILWSLKLISMRFLYLNNQTLQKLSGWYYKKSVSFSANYNMEYIRSALGIKLYVIPTF